MNHSHLMSRFIVLALLGRSTSAVDSPLEDVGAVWSNSKIAIAPDISQFAGASQVVRAMAHMPAPNMRARFEVADPSVEAKCDRDYNVLCPDKFVSIGPVKGGTKIYCTADSEYSGPCQGAYAFESMSPSAKHQWSERCLSSWPCKHCTRDYRAPCPTEWRHEGGGICTPSPEYTGPCAAASDFGSYNEAMRDAWSNMCEAFWSCLVDEGPQYAQHMLAAAESNGHQPASPVSFLAAKTIPVDGYKIRNSLYLTVSAYW